jgi:hypothetical protein
MPSSILNSDDGVISGTSGLKSSGGDDGVLVFQSKGTETARINTDKQIVAAAGTASLPVITTTGDTNTGIFFPAADTIAFAEGGAEAMRIPSDGNLLVGTTVAAGVVANGGTVVSGGFRTISGGLTNLGNGTAYTMFTLTADFATWLVNVHGLVSSTTYSETAIVQLNNTSVRVDIISAGGGVVISNSGLNIQVTQTSGVTMNDLIWSAIRIR